MLKAGICGFGGLGHVHANSLWAADDVEVKAVCDINPGQLTAKEVQFNIATEQSAFDVTSVNTYLKYEDMLASEDLDLVVIATPTDLHADYSIMALESGRHVFCEKPMALNVEDCDRMVAARNRTGKELMIGQCLRFWPAYEYLHGCVKDGRFGKLQSLTMERYGSFHAPGSWFNEGKRSGGALIDLHVHDVDWVYMAMGRPDSIYARGRIGMTGEVDDVSAIWDYANGPVVTLRGSWMNPGKFVMSFTAFFDGGVVEFNPATFGLRVFDADRQQVEVELSTEMGYPRETRYFLECVRGDHSNVLCTPESTRENIALAIDERQCVLENLKG